MSVLVCFKFLDISLRPLDLRCLQYHTIYNIGLSSNHDVYMFNVFSFK